MGPIGVKKHLAPFLPSHPVVSLKAPFDLLYKRTSKMTSFIFSNWFLKIFHWRLMWWIYFRWTVGKNFLTRPYCYQFYKQSGACAFICKIYSRTSRVILLHPPLSLITCSLSVCLYSEGVNRWNSGTWKARATRYYLCSALGFCSDFADLVYLYSHDGVQGPNWCIQDSHPECKLHG